MQLNIEVAHSLHETAAKPVYEANWIVLKTVWYSIKVLLSPCILRDSRPLVRPFKWGTTGRGQCIGTANRTYFKAGVKDTWKWY